MIAPRFVSTSSRLSRSDSSHDPGRALAVPAARTVRESDLGNPKTWSAFARSFALEPISPINSVDSSNLEFSTASHDGFDGDAGKDR